MQYLISFLEGIVTFISACILPMLPIYITYFAGGGEREARKTLINSIGFVLGMPFIISALLIDQIKSAFVWIKKNYKVINTVCGIFLFIIGLLMATGMMGYFLRWLSYRRGDMKKRTIAWIIALVFVIGAAVISYSLLSLSADQQGAGGGGTAPDFLIYDKDGNEIT